MDDSVGEIDIRTEDGATLALAAVRDKISTMERGKAEFEKNLSVAREEERLLQRLCELRRGTSVPIGPVDKVEIRDAANDLGRSALFAVKEELSASGRPLHISELMRLLNDRQVPIPGAGAQANLIAHMRRCKDIARPSRGMYALAISGLKDIPTKSGRRRRKRVRARVDSKERK